jgi:hypothetical protein
MWFTLTRSLLGSLSQSGSCIEDRATGGGTTQWNFRFTCRWKTLWNI